MTIEEWFKEAKRKVFEFLNTKELIYDVSEAQDKQLTACELMDLLEEKYPYHDEFSVTLFDCIDQSDFVQYIENRYNVKAIEITEYLF